MAAKWKQMTIFGKSSVAADAPEAMVSLRNIAKLPFAPDGPQRRQDDTRSSGS